MNRTTDQTNQYLEIAIQAVLDQYSDRLPELLAGRNSPLIQDMAAEIANKAAKLQFITEHALMELETDMEMER